MSGTFSRRNAAKNFLSAGAIALLGASFAEADQPHMQAALRALNRAAAELQAAADDKGGHREKAIRLVSDAINQVQQGIQVGMGK